MSSNKYCPILATLGYVLSQDKNSVLLVNRSKREHDIHYGKFNGLGGKLEPGEDVVSGMVREIREEAAIEPVDVILRGTINWPGFGPDGENWFGFIFRIDSWTGTPLTENPEGYLEWIPLNKLDETNLWESDRAWLGMIFDNDKRVFHGIAPFEEGKMTSWGYQRI
ncbi:MAG: 8-oxo-dGTP diphosphatase [Cyanobacteria bacterium]|nr:8-oxo-dGTP diphosphatase [Cyanobacteriota bacterium]